MIPESVRIGATDWKVTQNDQRLIDEEKMGECNKCSQTLHIAPNLSKDCEEETLLHEILHACCNFAGLDQEDKKLTEEQFISRLSPVLHMTLKQNGCWRFGKADKLPS